MPKKTRRRRVPAILAAVVQPVAKRLSRIEALLIEVRCEQDIQLKRVAALRAELDTVVEHVCVDRANIQRLSQADGDELAQGRPKNRTEGRK